jgi:RimJ/RimL family protein N-acetyltransferase
MSLACTNSTIVRTDGPGEVRLRRVPAAEAGRIVDSVFDGLSANSRFLRFHSPIPRLNDLLRRRLIDLDGRRRAVVVAEVARDGLDPLPIGLARLADDGHGVADIAIEVVDSWQRQGIGRQLLAQLAELAAEIGYTQLRGAVLPENVAMQRLARRAFPLARSHFDGDVLQLVVPLGAAAWTVTEDDVLADLLSRGHP